MARLILSTSNIMTAGPSIIRKPGGDRSNLELTNSLRANFLAAQQDYTPPSSATEGSTDSLGSGRTADRPRLDVWTETTGADVYVPRIDWSLSGLAEERSQYDITVKLFFLPGAELAARAQYTRDAVALVLKELGVDSVDLLVLSFPGMSFEGDCEFEADRRNSAQGNDEEEIETWPVVEELHRQGVARKLGISEFGSEKLARFLTRVKVRPEVDQINVRDCCNVPPPLTKLARAEGIELLTHFDCTNILPSGTLRDLLGQGPGGASVLAGGDGEGAAGGLRGDLRPQWVVKYTAVVRDRGVIENKGYFAAAELRG